MLNTALLERQLGEKRDATLALIKTTSEKAQAENREYTPEERSAIDASAAATREMHATLTRARGDDSLIAEMQRLNATAAAVPARTNGTRPRTLGEQFVASAEYNGFFKQQAGHRVQSSWRSPGIELDPTQHAAALRLMGATLTEDPASGGALVTPQYVSGIVQPSPMPIVVADLLAPGTTDSNLVAYMREKVFINAADTVLEGAAKPESTLTFEAAQDPVRKIAHWLPVTEEMLEDVPQIRSYIDSRLRTGVQMVEDDQLLNGDGVAPNLLGIRARAGLAAAYALQTGQSNADAILGQTLAIFSSSYLMPTGYVLNPQDWAATLMTKDSNGQYYTGGPFSPIQSANLWGLPVALTPAMTQHTALVGAFKTAAQIFRRGGIRVEASNSHQDFFVKNLVAIRAEERLALAVYRPGAFGEVTGLTPATP